MTATSSSSFTSKLIPYLVGSVLTLNFMIFWAVPYVVMGQLWRNALKNILLPIYNKVDQHPIIRKFAVKYIYTRAEFADYFLTTLLVLLNTFLSFSAVLYWQLTYSRLPMWLIYAYYFSWVGFGARIMGSAYALSHREGHYQTMYKPWIRNTVGLVFEAWVGMLFGNVPFNFATSHIFIHHRLDAGCGDTFYIWDLDRSSPTQFLLYVHRIFLYFTGITSYRYFVAHNYISKASQLAHGIQRYWLTAATLLAITRSPSFVFWIFLQPLFCMSYFLALINVSLHAFLEFDPTTGKPIPTVCATTIIGGEDDYFGEDDHNAHHYYPSVYYKDLPTHQQAQAQTESAITHHTSLFKGISIVELSVFILANLWDKVADHFVDVSGTLSRDEVIDLLKTRAKRTELSYDEYAPSLMNPSRAKQTELRTIIERKIGFTSKDTVVKGHATDEDKAGDGTATSPSTPPLEDCPEPEEATLIE